MEKLTSSEIRKLFLHYFQKNGHRVIPSSSLVPQNDETLLFTNAGMVQFKDVFLGREKPNYPCAASVQKCVRAGGKHNDLENVGYTTRHHTFFEMLGNFSFGDYFKHEAIKYAWDFLTNILNIPAERLWVTIHQQDKEAEKIWLHDIGVSEKRFRRLGDADNFWAMGETGPCGYCSEIHYDHGAQLPGEPSGSGKEGERYVEIWNLVFMQFERDVDGSLAALPKPSIDTGMGLERIAAVLQGAHDNYQTDIFADLIYTFARKIAELTAENETKYMVSLRIIADHVRAIAFLISDGVMPSNEGRGYVLRRIIRRAERHLRKLPIAPHHEVYLYQLIARLVALMTDAYPELVQSQQLIEKVLAREEVMFRETLDRGLKLFEDTLKNLTGTVLAGEVVFKLYDTYGFPFDLTLELAKERGLTVEVAGFNREMEQQQARSRDTSKFSDAQVIQTMTAQFPDTSFVGYEKLHEESKVLSIIKQQSEAPYLSPGDEGIVILAATPFYAESGGQVGDSGIITTSSASFVVTDTKKQGNVYLHYGKMQNGVLSVNEQVVAQVDAAKRVSTMANHTAAHLLQAALRRVLGKHVAQRGSYVDALRLRFDFTHFEALTDEQIKRVETLVNEMIARDLLVDVKNMSLSRAKESGALALFGEKYGEEVRVIDINGESVELCGGTHVHDTGVIGIFKITSESSIAAGIRRIEAVTGARVIAWFEQREQALHQENTIVLARETALKQELNKVKTQLIMARASELIAQASEKNGIKVLITKMDIDDNKTLRTMVETLKQKLVKAIVVAAAVINGKVQLVVGVQNCELSANELVKYLTVKVGGNGGGKADMAQTGSIEISALDNVLREAENWINTKI